MSDTADQQSSNGAAGGSSAHSLLGVALTGQCLTKPAEGTWQYRLTGTSWTNCAKAAERHRLRCM
jgi:hypothetical protein